MNTLSRSRTNDLLVAALPVTVWAIPFDALPFLPAEYRPLGAYLALLFVGAAVILLLLNRFGRDAEGFWLVVALYAYTVPVSFLRGYQLGSFAGTIDFSLSFSIGIMFFTVCFASVSSLVRRTSRAGALEAIAHMVIPVAWFMAAFGALEIAGIVFSPIRQAMRPFFRLVAELDQLGVQWFSREPAWGFLNAFVLLPFVTYVSRTTGRHLALLTILYVEVLFTFSATAIITILTYQFLAVLAVSRRKGVILLAAVGGAVAVFWLVRILIASPIGGVRQIARFAAVVQSLDITDLLRFSSSETIRIGFPIAGVLQVQNGPLLGVGGGASRYYFREIMYEIMPWSQNMHEVRGYVEAQSSAATPRNLYARVIGEFGILGVVLFAGIVSKAVSSFRRFPDHQSEEWRLLVRLALVTLLVNLQFDSMALVPFWFTLSILLAIAATPPGEA